MGSVARFRVSEYDESVERQYVALRRYLDGKKQPIKLNPAHLLMYAVSVACLIGGMLIPPPIKLAFYIAAIGFVWVGANLRRRSLPEPDPNQTYFDLVREAAHSSGSQYRDAITLGLLEQAAAAREGLLKLVCQWNERGADAHWLEWGAEAAESTDSTLDEIILSSQDLFLRYRPGQPANENDPAYSDLRDKVGKLVRLEQEALAQSAQVAGSSLEDSLKNLEHLRDAEREISGELDVRG